MVLDVCGCSRVERLARRSRGDVVVGCFVGQQTLVEVAMGCIRFPAVKLVVAAWASMCWRGGPVVCGCKPCGRNGAACGHCMGETVGEIVKLMA